MKRTIIIGDVHGCRTQLEQLLEKINYAQGVDRLISLGDLMDRGPDSAACVRLARTVGAELVQSNHDDKHVRYRAWLERKARGDVNPGDKPPRLRDERIVENEKLDDADVAYLRDAPNYILLPESEYGVEFALVHGGFLPRIPIEKQKRQDLIRLRWVTPQGEVAKPPKSDDALHQPEGSMWWMELYDGPYDVVYGHAVHSLVSPRFDYLSRPERRENWKKVCVLRGIDTGCCFGGRLTALVIDGMGTSFEQVDGEKYAKWYGVNGGEPE